MPESLTLTVNGAKQTVAADPDTPLLFVLRNDLKLTGPKMGCGMAQCGACAVLLDGEEVRTCITPLSYAAGKKVTTIEGLPEDHPVRRAWIEEQVPQCGYCQSGQIMAAVALLGKNPNPSDSDIDSVMDSMLCRCGTYNRIRRAIHRAAQEVNVR